MFITKREFNSLAVDLMYTKLRVNGLERSIKQYCDEIKEIIDNNQSIIDTNKLVLDKLEEILKANSLE